MSRDFREALLNYVLKNSHPGDASSVINTIDEYGWTQQALMNIGDRKGKILDAALQSRQPKTAMIVADNIIYPGAPDHVNYVRNNPHYTSTFHESILEYNKNIRDGVEVSIRQ
ncbi:unnamed protein product [Rotaria sordida]|uniref:Uncharacterized protein n=1 Tax=Rotaria sordida TaxID=392033 RepID=A0A819ZVR0_9BILA|nr:unnamed protein product [Rotaria sordida]CAF4131969.1 unnamed protein product [Rotaria sordida]CAF4168034.1 unnamed protein product [Rotaria sordida]